MRSNIVIRKYQEEDAIYLAKIYYNTIHRVNIRDYSEEQVNVWAPDSCLELDGWKKKWKKITPLVATNRNKIVGFIEFESNGHIDCFYCHHDWIGKGVGSELMQAIEERAKQQNIKRIYAEVSITAKNFFKSKGFYILKKQTIVRQGVNLENFIMEKTL